MSWNCPHCGHPCTSQRGRTQHINKSSKCKAAQRSTIGLGDFTVRTGSTSLQAGRTPPGSPAAVFRRQSKRRRGNTNEEEAKASVPEVYEGSGIEIDYDVFGYAGDEDPDDEDDETGEDLVDMEAGEAKQGEEGDRPAPNTQILEDF